MFLNYLHVHSLIIFCGTFSSKFIEYHIYNYVSYSGSLILFLLSAVYSNFMSFTVSLCWSICPTHSQGSLCPGIMTYAHLHTCTRNYYIQSVGLAFLTPPPPTPFIWKGSSARFRTHVRLWHPVGAHCQLSKKLVSSLAISLVCKKLNSELATSVMVTGTIFSHESNSLAILQATECKCPLFPGFV